MTRSRVELLRDLDRDTGWVLLVDGVEQSYVDLADATHLEFEYIQHMALVLDAARRPPDAVAAVHLGGGALTMPRWLTVTRPGSQHLVIESSREVLDVAASLAPVPDCRFVVGDACEVVAELPAASCDVVIWDLYEGPRAVVAALTLQAITQFRRIVRAPGGLALLNVSDVQPFDVVRPVVAALQVCFTDVALLAEPATLRGRRSGNCVVVATAESVLPVDDLRRRAAGAAVRARVVAGDELVEFVGAAVPGTDEAPLPQPDGVLGRGFL